MGYGVYRKIRGQKKISVCKRNSFQENQRTSKWTTKKRIIRDYWSSRVSKKEQFLTL